MVMNMNDENYIVAWWLFKGQENYVEGCWLKGWGWLERWWLDFIQGWVWNGVDKLGCSCALVWQFVGFVFKL